MRIQFLLVFSALFVLASLAFADTAPQPAVTPPTRAEVIATRAQGRYLATITLDNKKQIEVVLEGAEMPYTVTNFIKLAQAKFYDGLTFHRVVPDFVIQGGDPKGDGSGGPGYAINLEISPYLRHKKGVISMARTSAPDSAGSQFFITLKETAFLDGGYAVFGWVKSGMDVVDGVKPGDKIATVTIKPYSGTEPCPIQADENKPTK